MVVFVSLVITPFITNLFHCYHAMQKDILLSDLNSSFPSGISPCLKENKMMTSSPLASPV